MNIMGVHPVGFIGAVLMLTGILMVWFSPKPYRIGNGTIIINYTDGSDSHGNGGAAGPNK